MQFPGASVSIAPGIATLNDEVRHDPVKGQTIEISFARQRNEIVCRERGIEHIELQFNRSLLRVDVHMWGRLTG